MKMTITRNAKRASRMICLEITDYDLTIVDLNEFDEWLIDQCSEKGSIADQLLALETIVRNLEDAKEKSDASR